MEYIIAKNGKNSTPKKHYKKWQKEEFEYLFDQYMSGKTVKEIAKKLDRTKNFCYSKMTYKIGKSKNETAN